MKTVLVVLIFATATWCMPPDVYKSEFIKFKEHFNRTYANETEEMYRLKVFSENLDKILEHNQKYRKEEESYKLGITKFADMTYEEYLNFVEQGGFRHFETNVTPEEYKEEFFRFKEKYHKTYPTKEEEEYRFKIFCENLHRIIEHNELYKKGLISYKEGVTNFTDFTPDEFMEWLEEQGGGHWVTVDPPSGIQTEEYKQEFLRFKEKFHKSYPTEEEEKHRFEIFIRNFDQIVKHNELYDQGIISYKEGVTNFTDFTHDEYMKWLDEEGGGHWTTALPLQSYLEEFEEFKIRFHKSYTNKTEETYRFNIFSKNFDKIVRHNEKYENGTESYEEKVTIFTDMTKKEFQKWLEEHGGGRPPWAPTRE